MDTEQAESKLHYFGATGVLAARNLTSQTQSRHAFHTAVLGHFETENTSRVVS